MLEKDHKSQFPDIMNDIMNDKKGHNIVNDIEQLFISQTANLFMTATHKRYCACIFRVLQEVPERVPGHVHPGQLVRVGRTHPKLSLLQLLTQLQRQEDQARRQLLQGLPH